MSGFIKGEDRFQATLFPERIDDYVAEDSSVRVIDVFIDELDLSGTGASWKDGARTFQSREARVTTTAPRVGGLLPAPGIRWSWLGSFARRSDSAACELKETGKF
jgi:hypothetical protein